MKIKNKKINITLDETVFDSPNTTQFEVDADEVLNVEFILDDFAKSLLEMAKEIYPQGEYNGFI